MKINQNSSMRSPESVVTPQTELQNVPVKPADSSIENAATLKEADARNVGLQKMTTETKSMSNLTAGLLQKSLPDALPSRSELLTNAAEGLRPKVPEMLAKSGNDPDKFMSAVREQVESSTIYPNLGSMGDGDIMALAFIVMMEASKSAQEDLKDIMEGVKHINKSKEQLRDLMEQVSQKTSYMPKDDDD